MNTERTLYEIEVALSKSDAFNFVRNIIAFNVNGMSDSLSIWHECDMLVLSKSGYLTEIEIKRSWADSRKGILTKEEALSSISITVFQNACLNKFTINWMN